MTDSEVAPDPRTFTLTDEQEAALRRLANSDNSANSIAMAVLHCASGVSYTLDNSVRSISDSSSEFESASS